MAAGPPFPVVGVGASAGGLEAFTRLLRALPIDTGMAFVLVQHLAPQHPSALARILSGATAMPVKEVEGDGVIEPDHVYVIPPGRNLVLAGGRLELTTREAHGVQHPIDAFFRSLAKEQCEQAIGVVLSGTATDGTLGLEEIKAEGGITFAQDESSAQFDGMLKSAIASGCADFVMSPEDIAAEIARIGARSGVAAALPAGEGAGPSTAIWDQAALLPILLTLRDAAGADFTRYKTNTVSRRIQRRMTLQRIERIEDYASYLASHPPEVQALYQDILINVTGFFRDPEMFEALRSEVLPQMLSERPADEPLRIWTLGCSTGEEAYSLAMVVTEVLGANGRHPPPQIFATDLNAAGIEHARAGCFSQRRIAGISPERLGRFFVQEDDGWRVTKALRDLCVFARHDANVEPPFSRMDLVSCRNMLIYLDPSLQQRILPILHYALKPTGRLVLGRSESVGPFLDLFRVIDGKHKFYAPKPRVGRLPSRLFESGPRLPRSPAAPGAAAASPAPVRPGRRQPRTTSAELQQDVDRILAERFAPPGVLVDARLDIVHFRGDTHPYLGAAPGKASLSVLKMVHPEVAAPLRALLFRARIEPGPLREEGLRLEHDGVVHHFALEVIAVPADEPSEGALLVLFAPDPATKGATTPAEPEAGDPAPDGPGDETEGARLARLERDLTIARAQLHSMFEQQDAASDQLQATSEEAQSAIEELQSMNEELESSKEEIQSSVEELTTLNDELNIRNQETVQLNDDLLNLVRSFDIAIVMVGRDLNIRRCSPQAQAQFNITPSDIGRSLPAIRMTPPIADLAILVTQAIDEAVSLERGVQDRHGNWFSLRIGPYRTQDGRIDGAVLALVDVNTLRRARDYAQGIVSTVREPLVILDAEFRVQNANSSFYRTFDATPEETTGRLLFELGNRQWDLPPLRRLLGEVLQHGAAFDDFPVVHAFEHIGTKTMLLNARKLVAPGDEHPSILLAIEDISERQRLEDELKLRLEDLARADNDKAQFLAVLAHELRTPLNAVHGWVQLLRRPDMPSEDVEKGLEVIERNTRAQSKLIGDLIDVQQATSGKIRLEMADMDLVALVDAAIDAAAPAAGAKGIRLEREVPPGQVGILGDANRLLQVLGNLLVNALKFTPGGGVVRVALRRSATHAVVSVSDSGEGIDAVSLPHIFAQFRQASQSTHRGHGGLGLGLTISRQLVELQGGVIEVHSEGVGLGTTFRVTLPLKPVDATIRPVDAAPNSDAGPSRPIAGALVLVVDDEPAGREFVRRSLEAAGAETVAVSSVEEGILLVRQQRPDVIVSDLSMPGRDGYHFVREVRRLPAASGGRTPAIALTSFTTEFDRAEALAAGFQEHLAKPVEVAALVAAVAALMPPAGADGPRVRKL